MVTPWMPRSAGWVPSPTIQPRPSRSQTYSYMGLSTIVQQLDGNNVGLSYLQQAGDTSAITSGSQYAGDPVTGLGRFGQVVDQNWVLNPTPASTPTPTPTPAPVSTDRTQLGYDQAGDVLCITTR